MKPMELVSAGFYVALGFCAAKLVFAFAEGVFVKLLEIISGRKP